MVSAWCFVGIAFASFVAVASAQGPPLPTWHPAGRRHVSTSLLEREQNSTGERVSSQHGGRRPVKEVMSAGCRKRVLCEAARTLTDMFPISGFWQGIVKGRPHPRNAYFAAWSRGLQDNECSDLYPDCSDSAAGVMLPLVNEAVGTRGVVSSFIERLSAPAASHVPRDPGAPRPSLVMEKLRKYRRRTNADRARAVSDVSTPPQV
ncbi:uncharacterized protein LOC142577748 [Dermacentor variabilis]|uniref:uncharacterized protein LOC142577748 n=1 Tax=Dermacentor variabilis TaxID=34621 RepID=UPI003F5CA15A